MSAEPLLSVRNLKVQFPIREGGVIRRIVAQIKAVDDVSFDIAKGETLGMVGESGCGKTTVGRAIVRLIQPTAGSIRFDGQELTGLGRREYRRLYKRFQMIYQDSHAAMDPRMRVGDIISEPLVIHGIGDRESRRQRVRELLGLVGLRDETAKVYPHEMSGGQRQRVCIARALALTPELIICDEPVSALDVSIQAQIMNLFRDLQDRLGLTYLFIAHDIAVVHHIADRILVMYLGKVMEVAPSDAVAAAPLHPYTQGLLAATPVPDPEVEQTREQTIVEGELPSPANPPAGCRFCTRCPSAGAVKVDYGIDCARIEPSLREVAADHWVACHLHAACRP